MQAIEAISQNYVDSAKLIRFQFIADALLKRLEKDDDQEEEEEKSRYDVEIAREALRRAGEICKRGGTRNAEIFKSIRERKIKLKELRGGGDVNMDNNGGGGRRRRRRGRRFRGKLVTSDGFGKPKRKKTIGRRVNFLESELFERVHSISAQRFGRLLLQHW